MPSTHPQPTPRPKTKHPSASHLPISPTTQNPRANLHNYTTTTTTTTKPTTIIKPKSTAEHHPKPHPNRTSHTHTHQITIPPRHRELSLTDSEISILDLGPSLLVLGEEADGKVLAHGVEGLDLKIERRGGSGSGAGSLDGYCWDRGQLAGEEGGGDVRGPGRGQMQMQMPVLRGEKGRNEKGKTAMGHHAQPSGNGEGCGLGGILGI
ncbi:uncharacterized protein BO97DRAFT_413062 [Aspergillus homomorphus CBS 101889]|uniref:Uncharacterized protein n=1 Tax=Aspergillus homomorphus (strain CBS 101889) TaxID=1450537 RepID=A0A395I279_ASPHC|nr:hypothetical protein BO97DRAFT_413062 [Aspergillus homomorphus CBS 101889]RAL13845.1 hypothetical protein BO97DRAFT_413062 [Aspergillus homomorphus CBS 101889]